MASRHSHPRSMFSAGTTQWASKQVSTRNVVAIPVIGMSLYPKILDQYYGTICET